VDDDPVDPNFGALSTACSGSAGGSVTVDSGTVTGERVGGGGTGSSSAGAGGGQLQCFLATFMAFLAPFLFVLSAVSVQSSANVHGERISKCICPCESYLFANVRILQMATTLQVFIVQRLCACVSVHGAAFVHGSASVRHCKSAPIAVVE
jgi:hypothetical protein